MAEENQQPPESGGQPARSPPQTPEGRKDPQARQGRGQHRNDRPRHHGTRRDSHRRDQQHPRPPQQKPLEPKDTEDGNDEDQETGRDRSSPQNRHHRRGGRPPKKIIEEWINDPYCE